MMSSPSEKRMGISGLTSSQKTAMRQSAIIARSPRSRAGEAPVVGGRRGERFTLVFLSNVGFNHAAHDRRGHRCSFAGMLGHRHDGDLRLRKRRVGGKPGVGLP